MALFIEIHYYSSGPSGVTTPVTELVAFENQSRSMCDRFVSNPISPDSNSLGDVWAASPTLRDVYKPHRKIVNNLHWRTEN